MLSLGQVHLDPQIVHNESLVTYDSPAIGPIREPRPAARFGAERSPDPVGAPRLGQHSTAVLAELGYDAEGIRDLLRAEVVWASD